MLLDFNKDFRYLETNEETPVEITGLHQTPTTVLIKQMGLRMVSLHYYELIIDVDELNKKFEPVDNMQMLFFNKHTRSFVTYSQLYVSKENKNLFVEVDPDLLLNEEYDTFIDKKFKIIGYYYPYDMKDEVESIKNILNNIEFENINNYSKISLVIKTSSGFQFKKHSIKPLDVNIDTMYNDSFKSVHEYVVDKMLNSDKGIIMFHGKAGTGKTNYIKHLTTIITNKQFVFVPATVIPYLTDPSFITQLIDNKGSVLVLEDCETYLRDRNDSLSSYNDVVSTILNLSDGILSDVLGVQIICTFNADLRKIDEALLRKGRLIAEYKFEELSADKVKELLKTKGVDYKESKPLVLSEIFNIEETHFKTENKRQKIGFR